MKVLSAINGTYNSLAMRDSSPKLMKSSRDSKLFKCKQEITILFLKFVAMLGLPK